MDTWDKMSKRFLLPIYQECVFFFHLRVFAECNLFVQDASRMLWDASAS